ncbi:MAG: PKD domain-containing protein [Calditrichia bacterium]
MNIKRILLLLLICLSLLALVQTGCDELITEQIFTTIAGHPTADFDLDTSSSDVGCIPHTVSFIDLSDGPRDGWLWDFGDDSISTDTNPTHTYY